MRILEGPYLTRATLVMLVTMLALVMAPSAAAAPPWLQVGTGSLNATPTSGGTSIDAAMVGTVPHVAWSEAGAVYVKSWSSPTWSTVGGRINGTGAGRDVRIASDGTRPWAAYIETVGSAGNVFVRQWDGTSWVQRGGALNLSGTTNAERLDITMSGTTPYVVWRENSTPARVHVKRWDGTSWVSVGGAVNVDNTRDAAYPSIAATGTTPYVALQQWNGSKWQAYVRRWDGASWATHGTVLNVSTGQNAWEPKVVLDGTTPYVTWTEESAAGRDLYVRRWGGTSWAAVGTGPVNDYWATMTDMWVSGGTIYLTWGEYENTYGQVAARWDGTAWRQIGGILNVETANSGKDGALMMNGSEPWVAWLEDLGGARQAYVKRFAPNNSMVGPLSNVAVETTPSSVRLSWTNPPDAAFAGTRIYRATTQGTLGTLVATVAVGAAPNDAYVDSTVAANTTYYYHLVAYDTLGNERETNYDTAESWISPARYGGSVATDGTRAWTFGGCTRCVLTTDIWEYDPATDVTAKLSAALPTGGRYRTRSVWVGGSVNRVFVIGGDNASTALPDILSFNPANNTVTSVGSMPGGRVEGAAVYAPNTGRIYYLGGASQAGGTIYDTIYEIDPATGNSVDTGLRLPAATWRINGVYWPGDGCIYAAGGNVPAGKSDRVIRFCPSTGTVGYLPVTLPTPTTEVAAAAGTDEIFLIGGDTGSYTRDVYSFRPSHGTILRHAMRLQLPAVTNTAATTTGGVVYAMQSYPVTEKVQLLAPSSLIRARTTQLPATPVNATPAADELVASGQVPLSASAFSDPDVGDTHGASQWQVRTDAGTWASPLWDSGVTTSSLTTATTAPISTTGRYWFRVRYRDSNFGWSAWSTETTFRINLSAPTATPTSPADAAWVTSTRPRVEARYDDAEGDPGVITFELCAAVPTGSWSTSCGATYQSGTSLPGLAAGSTAAWEPGTVLTQGTWYWRVRGDDGTVGPWSPARSFRVDSVAPPVPPAPNAQRSGLGKITITWTAVTDPAPGSGGITYDVETSLDGSTWTTTCTDVTTTSCTRSGLGGQELLHVRVRACDVAGNCSGWAASSATTGSGYFLRSTATTLLGVPNRLASLPPAGTLNTATSVRHHNRTGWFVVEPGTTNSAVPGVASEPADTPYAAPTGAGWVVDDYAGKSVAAGPIEIGITTASNSSSGVGTLHCRAWKVATSGGTISSSTFLQKQAVAGDVVDGVGATQRTCALPGFAARTAFAANEALYVELWLNVTSAGPAGSTLTLSVDDGSSYILAPSAGVAPDVPTYVSPADGATTAVAPALTARYTHPAGRDGIVEFEVAADSTFTTIVERGSSPTVTSTSTATWTPTLLTAGTSYWWRVRAVDKDGLDSSWSTPPRSLRTTTPPATPTAVAPTGGATTTSGTPTLTASAFSDTDAGDSHGASEWQVRTGTGSYATPAASSGVVASSLTSWSVSPALQAGQAYAWRVRYRDSHGAWSAWSADATFVTGSGSLTLGFDSSTASLGILTPGFDAAASSVVSVTATSPSGYELSVTDGSDTTSLAGTPGGSFGDWTGTGATPTTWTAGVNGTSGYFGATVVTTGGGAGAKLAKWGSGTSSTDYAGNRYAGLQSTSPVLLHEAFSATASTATITTGWRANSVATAPAGTYQSTVTFTLVAKP